jgi:hypothetical protein
MYQGMVMLQAVWTPLMLRQTTAGCRCSSAVQSTCSCAT